MWSCCAYKYNKKEVFKQILTEIPKPTPEYLKKKCHKPFTDIEGEWYLSHMWNTKPPINKPRVINKQKE